MNNVHESNETLSNVIRIFKSSVKDKEISDSSTMSELGIDSLTSVEIVMAMEEAFHVQINESEAASFGSKTISQIAHRIDELINEKKAEKKTS
jgi:acyl carrier protein